MRSTWVWFGPAESICCDVDALVSRIRRETVGSLSIQYNRNSSYFVRLSFPLQKERPRHLFWLGTDVLEKTAMFFSVAKTYPVMGQSDWFLSSTLLILLMSIIWKSLVAPNYNSISLFFYKYNKLVSYFFLPGRRRCWDNNKKIYYYDY